MKKTLVLVAALISLATGVAAQESTDNPIFRKGYRADIQVRASTSRQSHISSSHGYSFGNGLYLGGGAGVGAEYVPDFSADANVVAHVFADGKYNIANWKLSPFVAARVGAVLPIEGLDQPRFSATASVGVDWGRISVSAGYTLQKSMNGAEFGIGFSF